MGLRTRALAQVLGFGAPILSPAKYASSNVSTHRLHTKVRDTIVMFIGEGASHHSTRTPCFCLRLLSTVICLDTMLVKTVNVQFSSSKAPPPHGSPHCPLLMWFLSPLQDDVAGELQCPTVKDFMEYVLNRLNVTFINLDNPKVCLSVIRCKGAPQALHAVPRI